MGIVATKTTEIHAALASGGRIVTLGSIPSLDRFQAQAIWEMSDKGSSFPNSIQKLTAENAEVAEKKGQNLLKCV